MEWAVLVPELSVMDFDKSLTFYTDVLGFEVAFSRPEERFAYLQIGKAQIMLDQFVEGSSWQTGEMSYPLGRGINLEIVTHDIDALLERLKAENYPLKVPLEERWYRQDEVLNGQKQFLVMDPDGYLLRFVEPIGTKPV